MSVRLESPYLNSGGLWLKGNLHTHTSRSDGSASPQSMVMVYAAQDYDFLALSDHDMPPLTDGLDACGLVLLPAVEVSAGCPHVLDVGARRVVAPTGGQQALLDEINATSGFPVLCHPDWEENFNHYPWEQLAALTGYKGIEIFNGLCLDQAGSHLAVAKWDRLLALGRTVWGFANDDAHTLDETGRGWNVVQAHERTPEAILAALRAGRFYASSGVNIERIVCDGARLYVRAPNAQRIELFSRHGKRVHHVTGPELTIDATLFPGPFVRIECHGAGGVAAWSQPIAVRGGRWDALQARLPELAGRGRSSLRARRTERPPALSGRVDDPLWNEAEAFDTFITMEDGTPAPVRTEARALLCGETLFFAFRCEEPEPAALGKAGPGSLWGNDSIEIFLVPQGSGENCYHLLITVLGTTFAGCRRSGAGHPPQIEGRAVIADEGAWHGWTAEVAVPLAGLGLPLAPGTRWGFHLCRNRFPQRGTYMWSWVGASNHNVPLYGALEL